MNKETKNEDEKAYEKIKPYFKNKRERFSPGRLVFSIASTLFYILIFAPFLNKYILHWSVAYIIIPILMLLVNFISIQVGGILDEYKIYSLKDKSSISGSFWLGCGRIDEIDYYVFYEDGQFGFVKGKVECSETEIIETNLIEPCYKQILIDGVPSQFLFVPKNTIKKRFDL